MRLLSLDYDPVYGDDDCTRGTFDSDVSVFDYDVVIWDPGASLPQYTSAHPSRYQGLPSLADDASVRLVSDIERRRTEFADYVQAGKILIVIARPPQECYVATGEIQYSGTGRNRASTRMVRKTDLWKALPVAGEDLSITRGSGSRIQIAGSDSLSTFLKNRKQFYKYDSVMTKAPGTVVAKVQGTNRVVSSFVRTKGGGLLVLLPAPDLIKRISDKTGMPIFKSEATAIQDELLEAVVGLTSAIVTARPAWAADYATKAQLEIRDAVVKQETRIQAARNKLSALQKQRDQRDSRDQLFLGSGRSLELEVKAVFELLGCEVSEPEPGRDDWKVSFPDRNAVVEVKGVSKSGAEKHAAQLEKWVAGELEETGAAPKGILVVNTWRETDLFERTEADFPDQMIPYCVGREHCLITGLQLFVMQHEVEADQSRAEHWRNAILKTSGQLDGAADWQSILTRSESNDESISTENEG